MPANLPPQYFETERKLKDAKTPQERIRILEDLLSIVPKHKGTEKLQSLLKTKIAKLKISIEKKPATAKYSAIPHVEKSGAGQVILIGPPNSGKSSLVQSLTNAHPEIGDYPFTTRSPYPAMMKYENIHIQLVDTPPFTQDYMESWLPELIKTADAVVFVLDVGAPEPADTLFTLLAELEKRKITLFPDQKVQDGGQSFSMKRALIAANKTDACTGDRSLHELRALTEGKIEVISVSCLHGEGLGELKKKIFQLLDIIRVYSKIPGKKPDLEEPFTLKRGSSVMDLAKAVHKDFSQKLRYARIWSGNLYQGQMVNRDHIIQDEDIIELHL